MFSIGIVIFSCNKSEIFKSEIEGNTLNIIENTNNSFLSNYKSGNILFTYGSKTTGTTTKSYLKITDYSSTKEKIILTNFVIDTSVPSYKLTSHESVISEAKKVKNDFTLFDIKNVVELYEIFGRKILAQPQIDHSSQLVQSIFFHNATLKSIERGLEAETDCGCTPHPLYFGGKISFWCQEDYFIDPRAYLKAIDDRKYKMNSKEMEVYYYLQNNKSQAAISIDKLLNILEPKASFMQRIGNVYYKSTNKILKNNPPTTLAESGCLEGSDWGCCSNYSGCCWYWNILCFEHDIACLKCDHWYCGPLCKPE